MFFIIVFWNRCMDSAIINPRKVYNKYLFIKTFIMNYN